MSLALSFAFPGVITSLQSADGACLYAVSRNHPERKVGRRVRQRCSPQHMPFFRLLSCNTKQLPTLFMGTYWGASPFARQALLQGRSHVADYGTQTGSIRDRRAGVENARSRICVTTVETSFSSTRLNTQLASRVHLSEAPGCVRRPASLPAIRTADSRYSETRFKMLIGVMEDDETSAFTGFSSVCTPQPGIKPAHQCCCGLP